MTVKRQFLLREKNTRNFFSFSRYSKHLLNLSVLEKVNIYEIINETKLFMKLRIGLSKGLQELKKILYSTRI